MEEKLLKAEVVKIIEETKDVKTFRFRPLNGEKISFCAGQFVFMYVDFEENGKKERVRRAYSIASSPMKTGFVDLTLKLTPDGKVTPFFHNKVRVGDKFDISEPMGKFTYTEDAGNSIVLIAGGSGIVPMKSIASYCTDKKLPTNVSILYSCKSPGDIIYRDELGEIEKQNPAIKNHITITREADGWQGNKGRIDRAFIENRVKDVQESMYYLCGPLEFIRGIAEILKSMGVDRTKIKRDVWA